MACCDCFRSVFTWIRCIVAIVTYSLDLAADITLGQRYYTDYWVKNTPTEWAIATWAIALTPGVINSLFNFCFLCQINPGVDMPKWTYSLGYFMSLFLMGPPWHHLVTMTKTCEIGVFGVEESEKLASVQRTIQATLQSLPQIFLQIYIVSTMNTVTPMQGIAMLTSLVSFINASFITIRCLNRRFHFGSSDLTITLLGTLWIALLLLSGVPSIALFAAEDVFGPAFSALIVIVFVYLLVLPLVVYTKTVFWKIVSALCQLAYTFTMATTLSLWYFNKKNVQHGLDSCREISLVEGTTSTFNLTSVEPTITSFSTGNASTPLFDATAAINATLSAATDSADVTSSYTEASFSNATEVVRVLREVADHEVNDKPILNLDETHCLSDWSLLIVIAVASANAIFFFYHMVLILAVRLRQQVAVSSIPSSQRSETKVASPGSLTRS